KAPYLTLLAFHKVLAQVPDARLTMVGDGDLLEACHQIAKSLSIDMRVDFVGQRQSADIANILKTARAFVQHSLQTSSGDSEGTPVAILEAGAAGIPVVSTRHAGIVDIVRDGETGYLVDERDIDSMAAC